MAAYAGGTGVVDVKETLKEEEAGGIDVEEAPEKEKTDGIDTSGNFHVETDIYDVHDYEQNPEVLRRINSRKAAVETV